MAEIRSAVAAYASGFDAALVSAADAQRIATEATAAEHMLAIIKALAAARVADTELWRKEGDASPAHQLARRSGTSVAKAKEALDTARRLSNQPEVQAAARRGELSPAQAGAVSDAAEAAPEAAARLLNTARRASLGELLDDCARTKAAAQPDDGARRRAIHASRFVRRRRAADGAGELHYRSTLDEVAEVYEVIKAFADKVFRAARAEGRREPNEAYLADGLLHAMRAAQDKAATGAGAAVQPAPSGPTANPAPTPANPAPAREPAAAPDQAPAAAHDGLKRDDPPNLFPAPTPTLVPPAPSPWAPVGVKMLVRVDLDALLRGWPIDGEVCEIPGMGPIPVSAARAMIHTGNAFLAAIVTKGCDVATVAHLGRRPSAYQRSALQWRSPECSRLGCNRTDDPRHPANARDGPASAETA